MSSVDIVVPSYNHIQYIDQCIDSILKQSFDNFKVIVIDDGSTDGSADHLLQNYSNQERITVVIQENRGLCNTLNRAIFEFCTSKYIIFIASDDQFLPDRILNQVQFMEREGFVLSYANFKVIDNAGNIQGQEGVKQKLAGALFEKLFLGEYNIPACTCIYELDTLKKMRGFSSDALVEDTDMYLKIASKFPIGFLDKFVSLYRRHEHNMSRTMTTEIYEDAIKRLDKYQDHPLYNKARKNLALPTLINLCKASRRLEALKIFYSEKPNIFNRQFLIALYYFTGASLFYDPYKNY